MYLRKRLVLVIAVTVCLANVYATDEISYPFVGVTHIHRNVTSPRLLDMQIVIIDLNADGIGFKVTPADSTSANETKVQTVTNFLIEQNAQIAINAGFFYYNPNVDVMGFAASDGDNYSPFTSWYDFPTPHIALNLTSNNTACMVYPDVWGSGGIATAPGGISDFYNAVPGSEWIVKHGVKKISDYHLNPALHPRTAAGFTQDDKLILFVVDGRNSGHSLGMYTSEVADILIEFGAYEGIALDGGGSTTMVFADPSPRLVNVPINGGVPYVERAVANSLAVYANFTQPELDRYIYNDFEAGNEGTFSLSPGYSGSTAGIISAESLADAVDTASNTGQWSQKIFIKDDPAVSGVSENSDGGWFVRHVSGSQASPSQNIVRPVSGYLGFYAKTANAGVGISIAIDNESQMERGLIKEMIADGQWHLYQWNLEDSNQWQGWFNGDGVVEQTDFSIDSIQILGPDADVELYIDTITHNPYDQVDLPANCQEVWQMGDGLQGDVDHDCDVDFDDMKQLAHEWVSTGDIADVAPIQGDGVVNMKDFAIIGRDWSKNNDPKN